jgi:hypothetical protein
MAVNLRTGSDPSGKVPQRPQRKKVRKINNADQLPQAKRGVVSKSYQQVRALAGFMDDQHFRAFAQEYILSLSKRQQSALLREADKARQEIAKLSPHPDFMAESRPLQATAYAEIVKDKTFNAVFGSASYRFAWVKLNNLVALQVFVNAQEENVPSKESELIEFALPNDWNVPAEISFIPPLGPIYIVSSSPQMAGLHVRLDDKKAQIIIAPPSHINLVQVMQFNGRYYLRNGYHRVVGALAAGITELPALVVDATQPADVELGNIGAAGFSVTHSMFLAHPPLVSDFNGTGTVEISMREKRYGASVSLQISPVNIGV